MGIGATAFGLTSLTTDQYARAKGTKRRLLFFTKSSGFEHSVIKREENGLSHAEKVLTGLALACGFDVTCSKDGSIITAENLSKFHAVFFFTTGDLTQEGEDKNPPMTPEGKAALLRAVENGMGFIGSHCATDTFHTPGDAFENHGDKVDPYIAMIGGEFIRHGPQQNATMHVVDKKFPGFNGLPDFQLNEEWYSLKDFAPDLHVLLVQDTQGMEGSDYQRPSYPATWARKHGKGRVFYTSMGHREDVWTNPIFQRILLGGVGWCLGTVRARLKPNLLAATPHHAILPPSS